jgi:hypothetical protein
MGTRRLQSEGLVELDAFALDPQSLNVVASIASVAR